MSAPISKADVLDLQRMLCFYGYGPLSLDGRYGPKTAAAELALRGDQDTLDHCALPSWDSRDARTASNLRTLHPQFAPIAGRYVEGVRDGDLEATARIISGRRSWPSQSALYAQGRTAPGKKVTNARAGFSFHNYGLAFDVGLFYPDGRYMTGQTKDERRLYALISTIRGARLDWGGDFPNVDAPHYHLAGHPIGALREMWMEGQALVVEGV